MCSTIKSGKSFVTPYKVSALGNEMFSLPYGYTAAINSFLEYKKLPANPEELIEDIFARRIKYNKTRIATLPEHLRSISDSTLRVLAELITFEFRVINQRSFVTSDIADNIAKSAASKLKRTKVFGAQSISDTDCQNLANHFELLQQTSDGMVTSGHDILADYLASFQLAKNWKKWTPHLKSSTGQEAWVYASSNLSGDKNINEYLKTLLATDLILAANACKKFHHKYWHTVETKIFEENKSTSKLKFGRASIAMSILASKSCINILQNDLASTNQDRSYNAQRALVLAGDTSIIQHCLEKNEPMASAGGIKVTGGSIEFWKAASPAHRTNIARQRVKNSHSTKNECIVLSLNTIAIFGDFTDIQDLKKITAWTKNLATFYAAIEALHSIDKNEAISFLNKLLKLPKNISPVYILEVLSLYGEELNIESFFDAFVQIKNYNPEKSLHLMERSVRLLSKHKLPEDAGERLRKVYQQATYSHRSNLWQIAQAQSLKEFDSLFWSILEEEPHSELGLALNFGKKRFKSEKEISKIISMCKIIKNHLVNDIGRRSWDLDRMLDYLVDQNELEYVANTISDIFKKYIGRHVDSRNNRRSQTPKERQDPRDSVDSFFVEFQICNLLTHAAQCEQYLTTDFKKSIVPMDVISTSDEIRNAQLQIISKLDENELDTEIEKVKDNYDQFALLGRISKLPLTSKRLSFILNLIPKVIEHHLSYSALKEIISNQWCNQIATTLVMSVKEACWEHFSSSQLFNDIEYLVSQLLTQEQVVHEVAPLLSKDISNPSKEILQFWYDTAMTRR